MLADIDLRRRVVMSKKRMLTEKYSISLLILTILSIGISLMGCKRTSEPDGDTASDDDLSYIELPLIDSQEKVPIIAAYYTGFGFGSSALNHMLMVWPDGTVIFSDDLIKGGPPYFTGTISQGEIESFFESLRAKNIFQRTYQTVHTGPEMGWTMLLVNSPKDGILVLESFHEYTELDARLVFTDNGITSLEGRTIKEVLKEQSEDYQLFRADWDFIRKGFDELIPDDQTAIETLKFKMILNWYEDTKRYE
ncbi:MAG: hypothetical protein KAS23_12120 [Anaerohalosphaera sp.]|nr:hypothetical protein [Anaerohalosphaera sp.]